jgi:type I restriction enzyme S subunit
MKPNEVKSVKLGDFIVECDERNSRGTALPMIGINREKEFMPTVANTSGLDITKYKIVRKGRFVFSGMQTGRDICIRLGLYMEDEPALISPAYTTFSIDESKGLLSEYVFIYFKREEMDRYGWFISDSSVRSNLDWPRFLEIEIPLISMEKQLAISQLFHCVQEQKKISDEMKTIFDGIWPSIIQSMTK